MNHQFIKPKRRKSPKKIDMCSLPNIPARDLEKLTQCRKNQTRKAETGNVKIVMSNYQPLEKSA
jgi:hypothetical protein